jgi:hypothetical protein
VCVILSCHFRVIFFLQTIDLGEERERKKGNLMIDNWTIEIIEGKKYWENPFLCVYITTQISLFFLSRTQISFNSKLTHFNNKRTYKHYLDVTQLLPCITITTKLFTVSLSCKKQSQKPRNKLSLSLSLSRSKRSASSSLHHQISIKPNMQV